MRRKDILIIAATLIIISFVSVFAIYCMVNEDNIFSKVTDKLSNVEENKKEYHSNGWETKVVDKIKYDVPIPVGFTYIEGNPNKGMIIENNATNEKYMWIPLGANTNSDIELDTSLDFSTQESIENMQKYGGFYVAIDERSEEERFEEYLKENAQSYEVYFQTKELGYEGYKKLYKETTGEEFGLNDIVIDEKTKLDNYKKTSILETHTLTIEELASINIYEEQIGKDIVLKECKTLTLSSIYIPAKDPNMPPPAINVNFDGEGTTTTEEERITGSQKNKIDEAIKYVSEVTRKSEKKIKEEIGYSTNDYEQMKKLLIEQVNNKETTYNKIISILDGIESNDTSTSDSKKEDKSEAIYVETGKTEEIRSGWSKEIVSEETEEGVPIPKGFEQVEGTKVKTGLKITNRSNLTFIWIPVKEVDARNIEEMINETFEKNLEELGDRESVIKDYTKEAELTKEEKAEYDELIASIKKYGGFYISEAELGYDENGVTINNYRNMVELYGEGTGYNYVSNGDYYRNVEEGNYYEEGTKAGEEQRKFNEEKYENGEYKTLYEKAIEKCEELYNDSIAVESHLTYGIEYKAAINYLIETGRITTKEAFEDSETIGKYKDTIGKHGVYAEENFLNGIYGLAGNLAEITRGKDEEGKVAVRGGSWNDLGTERALGSVIWKEEANLDDEAIGSVGFRACMYIKTVYNEEEHEEIEKKIGEEINNKIEEIKKYINEKSIKIAGDETNYFNNRYKEGTEEYEQEALNDMVKWAREQMEKETSTAMFNKFVEYVKDEVDRIVNNIISMIGYTGGYTYEVNEETKELNEKCWQEKANAMSKMQNLRWTEGILTNSEGKQVSYAEIRKEAEEKINEMLDKEKNNEENKEKQPNEPVSNETIEEVATKFLETGPKTWGYYESWKTEYEKLKDEYYNKIKNATSVEEAEELSKEGIDKINEMVDKVIAEKEKENNPEDKEPNDKKEKTQYQKDIEAGYKVYKSTDVTDKSLDESKLGTGEKLKDAVDTISTDQTLEPTSDDKHVDFAIVILNNYTDVHISRVIDGDYSVCYFDSPGEVKFRLYWENGMYRYIEYTIEEKEKEFAKGTIFYTLEKMYEQGSITSFGWVDLNGNWAENNKNGNLKSLESASNRIAFNANVNGSTWMFINLKGTNRFITRKPFAKADYDVAKKTKDNLWSTLNGGRKMNYTNYVNLPTKTDYQNLLKLRDTNNMGSYKFWHGITMSDADEFYVVQDGNKLGSGVFEIEKTVTSINIDEPSKKGKAAWSKYFDRDDNLHINQKYRLVVELNLNK